MTETSAPDPFVAAPEHKPADRVIVLFGATGDLAKRKLLPGIYRLARAGLLPERYLLIGAAPDDVDSAAFVEHARSAVEEFGSFGIDEASWADFAQRLSFIQTDGSDPAGFVKQLAAATGDLSDLPLLHYLSVPPAAAAGLVTMIGEADLATGARVIMEKPFGTDLASAQELNATVHSVFDESQVYRIDHFLGKEAVQNILALRFANGLFEPVWNRNTIDHVQIDVPETLSIEMRAAFYEATGAFRDMVVTHLFQVLGFVAMEPPTSLTAEALVNEKVKVFESMPTISPDQVVRGQYDGYRAEPGVAPDSQTETFIALEARVDNWRWSGVPFYLRTGKRLAQGARILTLAFKRPPHRMFPGDADDEGNKLVFDLGDPGSISALFMAKQPGPTMELGEADLTFDYERSFIADRELEAYQRLIHDALIGDHTLFTRADGIERLWEIATPFLESPPPVQPYFSGSWGPEDINELIAPRRWHLPDGIDR